MKLKSGLHYRTRQKGFTLVELLIVIVVIAIIAAIVIVAYAGISQRAKTSALISDLTNSANQLKIYQATNSAYPTSNDCSTGANPAPPLICLKSSSNSSYTGYTYNNSASPQTFSLTEQNGSLTYNITNDGIASVVSTVSTSGGIATTSGGYTINTFTSGGTFTVSGGSLTNVSVLIVGGGGGGGNDTSGGPGEGGGGGGGQFLALSGQTINGSTTVTVGAGGPADTNGSSSSFGSNVAIGGGAGAHYGSVPKSGASGGGAANVGGTGASGTAGNNGGNGGSGGVCGGLPGGGGGAGGAGVTGGSCVGGQGGVGLSSAISGTTSWYAGGGAAEDLSSQGGGGSNFGEIPSQNGGTPNTGGGGGSAGLGGSGIVIIQYTTP
jgi:prepilin-type N-terminal cleavage/methylation domain-containing protein